MGEILVAGVMLIAGILLCAMAFRYSTNISGWLKERRLLNGVNKEEIETLLKYGITDAGERVRDHKQKYLDAVAVAKDYVEHKD